MDKILEQPFRLTNLDPVIASVAGVAATWSDVWSYQVPNGTSLIVKPGHTLSVYGHDAGAELTFADVIKVEKRDSSKSDTLLLFGPALYTEVKEFQDSTKMARFSVPADGVVIHEREWLIVSFKAVGVVTLATSYFEMRIAKIRKALGS